MKELVRTFLLCALSLLPLAMLAEDGVVVEWMSDTVRVTNPCDTTITVKVEKMNVLLTTNNTESVSVTLKGMSN